MVLDVITWDVDPILLQYGPFRIGWYSLLFAFGLVVFGYAIVQKIWQYEHHSERSLTALFYYVVIGTVLGARLGHCLFYEPGYYLANPIEIIKIWEGGLASHGGVIGIIIAVYFYSQKVSKQHLFWTFDRLCVPTGLVAAMIRLGNLMNHEIYGHPTDLPWGFRFIENIPQWRAGAEPVYSLPSHPTQIYEALVYLVLFGVCMWLYWGRKMQKHVGFIFGFFMVVCFTARLLIEFVKNDQVDFEQAMSFNMGQLLSIPFIIIGIYAMWSSFSRQAKPISI